MAGFFSPLDTSGSPPNSNPIATNARTKESKVSPKNAVPHANAVMILKPARRGDVLASPISLTEYNASRLATVQITPENSPDS